MQVLALDTTTRAGSVALWRDGEITVLVGDASRTHGERLPGDILRLLDTAGASLATVDLYTVIAGPGSFTGLRVGIAAVQGLALAQGKRVVPIPALDAFAVADETARCADGRVGVWMDAQRQQVFAAAYTRSGATIVPAAGPASLTPEHAVDDWRARGFVPSCLIGDGLDRYGAVARHAWPSATIITPAPPLAPIAARLAAAAPERAVAPHAIVPIYVRPPDAELARERAR